MKRILFLFAFIFPLFISNCGGSKKGSVSTKPKAPSGIFTNSETLTSILENAQSKGKIVFVDMYTTWCAPCKVMDEEVFTDPSVVSLLNKNVISYKVDAEKGNGPDLSLIYNVQVFPTLLFLDDRGREITRSDGALSTTGFLNLAQSAIDQQGM